MGAPPGSHNSRGDLFFDEMAIALITTWNSDKAIISQTARTCAAAFMVNFKPPLRTEIEAFVRGEAARVVVLVKPRLASPLQYFRRSGFSPR